MISLSVWEWRKCLFCVLCNTCYCKWLKVLKKLTIRLIFLFPPIFIILWIFHTSTISFIQRVQTRAVMLMNTQTAKKGVMKPACWCPLWWWLASSSAWCSSSPVSPSLWAVCAKTAACTTPTCVPATVSGLTLWAPQYIKVTPWLCL